MIEKVEICEHDEALMHAKRMTLYVSLTFEGVPEGWSDLEGVKVKLGAEEGCTDLEGIKLGPEEGCTDTEGLKLGRGDSVGLPVGLLGL